MLVKVCGLTRGEDLRACQELGVDFSGFIFHPQSPRCVSPEWVGSLRKGKEQRVGVFVRQRAEEVIDIAQQAKLELVQLHGGQDVEACKEIGPERIIKVLWPERYERVEQLQNAVQCFAPVCKYFLLDSGKQGGGHGQTISSSLLEAIKFPRPWILAGGLSAENVHNLIQKFQPDVVDLNSGVENSPGIKNKQILQDILERIRK